MVAQVVSGTLIDQCHGCAGLWLDQEAFERLTAQSEQEGTTVLEDAGVLRRRAKGHVMSRSDSEVAYVRCPDCHDLMTRRNFAKRSGVVIDVCHAHGIWFDAEELGRILEFVRSGGLEESRARDREERRREDAQRRQFQEAPMRGVGWTTDRGDSLHDGIGLLDVVRAISRLF